MVLPAFEMEVRPTALAASSPVRSIPPTHTQDWGMGWAEEGKQATEAKQGI